MDIEKENDIHEFTNNNNSDETKDTSFCSDFDEEENLEINYTTKNILENLGNCILEMELNNNNSHGINHTEIILGGVYNKYEELLIQIAKRNVENNLKKNEPCFDEIKALLESDKNHRMLLSSNMKLINRTKKKLVKEVTKLLVEYVKNNFDINNQNNINIYEKEDFNDFTEKAEKEIKNKVEMELNNIKKTLIEKNNGNPNVINGVNNYIDKNGDNIVVLAKKIITFYYKEMQFYQDNNNKVYRILSGENLTIFNDQKKDVKGEDDNKIQEEHVNENNEEKKTNNEEEKEEKKKEDDNPFIKITEDIVVPGEYNYIYFNYNDYINGEFCGKIKIEHLYEYFQSLKLSTRIKIILNLEEEKIDNNEVLRDLLTLTDFYIFYDKTKLYDILKQLKEQEDNYHTEKLFLYHYREAEKRYKEKEENKQKEEDKVKKYKAFLEEKKMEKKNVKKNHNKSMDNQNKQLSQANITKNNIYITQQNEKEKEIEVDKVNEVVNTEENKQENIETNPNNNNNNTTTNNNNEVLQTEPVKEENKEKENERNNTKRKSNSVSKKNKLMPIRLTPPTPLGKNEIFDYFKIGICDRDPQKKPFRIIM